MGGWTGVRMMCGRVDWSKNGVLEGLPECGCVEGWNRLKMYPQMYTHPHTHTPTHTHCLLVRKFDSSCTEYLPAHFAIFLS